MFPIKAPPHLSLPIADVIAALSAIDLVDGLPDQRIMGLRVEDPDTVTVKTGEVPAALTGGGHLLRIERSRDGWRVSRVEAWCC
jgi:hypothetical protein